MKLRTRTFCFSLFVTALWASGNAYSNGDARLTPLPIELPQAENLHETAASSNEKGIPVLLVFVADGCPFCIEVEEDYLKPIMRSGDYTNKVLIRTVNIDEDSEVKSFDGTPTSPQKLQAKYDVFVTPTLVFVNSEGAEVGERLTGINTRDYYGAYLDQSIEAGARKIRASQE
ncbi:MAG: thioredoxin family protein [bacterium]